jgi:hypothetical protein
MKKTQIKSNLEEKKVLPPLWQSFFSVAPLKIKEKIFYNLDLGFFIRISIYLKEITQRQ